MSFNKKNIISLSGTQYDTLTSLIKKMEYNPPPKLASLFFINKKGKLSYYRINGWGNLEVWNKGACSYEPVNTSMYDNQLFSINDELLKTDVDSIQAINRANNLSKCKESYKDGYSQEELSVPNNFDDSNDIDSDINIVSATFEQSAEQENNTIDLLKSSKNVLLDYHNIAKFGYVKNLINKPSLISLYKKHLPIYYLLNRFIEDEDFYTVVYSNGSWDEPPYWQAILSNKYTIGTIYTNSRRCAKAVAQELNNLKVTPSNLHEHFVV